MRLSRQTSTVCGSLTLAIAMRLSNACPLRFLRLLACVCLLFAAPAAAWTCPATTVRDEFARADLVFVGEVVSQQGDLAELSIRRVLKGKATSRVSVEARIPDRELLRAPTPYPWRQSAPFLVLAYSSDTGLYITGCSYTGPIQRQDGRLLQLGLSTKDLTALRLPTNDGLAQALVAQWQRYRSAVDGCRDDACFQALRQDPRKEQALIEYYQREFEVERRLYAHLAADPRSFDFSSAHVAANEVQLRFTLAKPYQPPHELPYRQFTVVLYPLDSHPEQWRIGGITLQSQTSPSN